MVFHNRQFPTPVAWLSALARPVIPVLLVLLPAAGAPARPRTPVPSSGAQPPAAAPTTAAGHYREARRLYLRRDYEAALGHFRRAHQLEPRDFLLFNIAVCLERQERLAEALAQYRLYLRRVPTEAGALEARLRDLERRLEPGRVRIAGGLPGSDVFADGHFAGQLPLKNPIWSSPGRELTVRVLRPGYHPYETRLRVPAGAEVQLTIAQAPLAGPATEDRPVITVLSAPRPRTEDAFANLRAAPPADPRSQVPLTLGIAGTVLVAGGLCLGAWAWWKSDQAQGPASWEWERREDLSEDARRAAWGADALLLTGVALLTAFGLTY